MTVPDQGWSWVVALAAWFCSLVLAGIFRTFGVLFVAFIDVYGVTREEAAWPMGLCIGILNLTGPFAGILGQRYGIRPVVITGAVIGAIGMSACFFTSSLTVITVLVGGVYGFGHGLVNTLLPVIVNAYFVRLRSTANGIANSGSCIGSLVLPLAYEYFMQEFGLSGCFLLTGAIVLNVAVAGALLRPFHHTPDAPVAQRPLLGDEEDRRLSGDGDSRRQFQCVMKKEFSSLRTVRDDTQVLVPSSERMSQSDGDQEDGGFGNLDHQLDPRRRRLQAELVSALNKRTFQTSTSVIEESFESLNTSTSSSVFDANPSDRLQIELRRAQKEFEDTLSDFTTLETTSKSEEVLNEVKTSDLTDSCPARHSFSVSSAKRKARDRFRSQLPSSGPLKKYNFRLRHASGDSDLHPVSEQQLPLDGEEEENDVIDTSECTAVDVNPPEQHLQKDISESHVDDTSFFATQNQPTFLSSFSRVLSSVMFYVTAFTNVIFYFLFHMYLLVVVDYAMDQGVSEENAKYILFAFAVSDLVGRLGFGWVTDRKLLTRSKFTALGMIGIGLVFFAFPFTNQFWALLIASACYGLLLGCTMVLFPILLVEYLGHEVHGVAYGCMCFINGFTSFLRPAIVGYFRDSIGSYHYMFYILGTISLASSTLWVLEKCFSPIPPPPQLSSQQTEEKT